MRMTERLWIFPAILCVLCAVAIVEGVSIVGLILLVIWCIRLFYLKHRKILTISLIIGFLFLGNIFITQKMNHSNFSGEISTVQIYPKASSVKVDGNYLRFTGMVQVNNQQEEVVVTHYFKTEAAQQQWLNKPTTTWLVAHGEFTEPKPNSNFHQFNYQQYLKRQKIHWNFRIETFEYPEKITLKTPVKYSFEPYRQAILNYINQTFQTKIADYLNILFFADNRNFSEDQLDSFRALGVVHLFSISGFHIAYLTNIIRRLLLRIGITHERTNIILMFFLPIYGVISGFGISVLRAVTQQLLLLGSKQMNKELDTIDAWAMAMLFTLFLNPYHVYSLSFQLSYLLSGIFILMSKRKWIQTLNPLTYSLLFSILSSLASLPIVTYHFFEFPWITVLANLLFIPLFSNLLFPALLFLLLSSFFLRGMEAFVLYEQVLLLVIDFIENLTQTLTSKIDFVFVTGRLPLMIIVILSISIFAVIKRIEKKQRPAFFSIVCILMCMFYYRFVPVSQVTILDIGQGDSILLQTPFNRKVTLIDTGGQLQWGEQEKWAQREKSFSIGKDTIVPAFKSFGISKIDRLYLTHADADHSGEIKAIGQEMPIKEIAATKATFKEKQVKNQLLALDNIKLIDVKPPVKLTYPNEKTIVLHPLDILDGESKNNQSLVFYVTIGEDKWLFTGDVEKEAEHILIQQYPQLNVDYLKVSHHGSQTSTTNEFLEHVNPHTAFISVGENNSFGHPHEEVLENLRKNKVTTYMTSEEGAIAVKYFRVPVVNHWISTTKTVHKTR